MSLPFTLNCARRNRHSRHYWAVSGVAICLAAVVLLTSGCSPYPVYSTSRPSSPEDMEPAREERIGMDRPGSSTTQDLEFRDADEPVVEPGIFSEVVDTYLGVKYRLGGDDFDGIDCSNLVRALYRDYDGTRLPSSTRHLYRLPHSVSPDALAVGDLVFFSFNGSDVSHVGIYLGRGRFVHASESRGVIISSLNDPSFRDHYAGARRVM